MLRIMTRLESLARQEPPDEMRAKVVRVREIGRLRQRFRELRGGVTMAWVMRLSRGPVEQQLNWRDAGWEATAHHCPWRWHLLEETGEPSIRRCPGCHRSVWFCWSRSAANQHLLAGRSVVKAPVLVAE
jgi:hypothetical protein